MSRIFWIGTLSSSLFLSGCFYLGQERFEDIVKLPPSKWSSRDCLTVILTAMVHNLNDKEKNVECIATPFYPSVVMALNQLQRSKYHWSEEDAKLHMDELLRGSSGLYVDWRDGRLVNSKGNFFKNQTDIDSLLIMISLKNRTFPCAVPYATVMKAGATPEDPPHMVSAPLLPMADWPCYMPSISDIEQRIWLLDGSGDTLKPKYVWGRRNETLGSPETLFAMFPLRRSDKHFLVNSKSARLEIAGFDTKMKFEMDVAKMR